MSQYSPPVAAVLPAGDADALAELRPIARFRRFRREQDIHRQGDRCDIWYSVARGRRASTFSASTGGATSSTSTFPAISSASAVATGTGSASRRSSMER